MTQVTLAYKKAGLPAFMVVSIAASICWWNIIINSDNIYLDGITYDLLILACYLVVPVVMGWVPSLSQQSVYGIVISLIGIYLMKTG